MGMSPDQLGDLTQREFWNKLEGFYELEEYRERREWTRTRWQTCLFLNCYTSKENVLQPKDLIVFEWEEVERKEIVIPTIEDFERVKAKYGIS